MLTLTLNDVDIDNSNRWIYVITPEKIQEHYVSIFVSNTREPLSLTDYICMDLLWFLFGVSSYIFKARCQY